MTTELILREPKHRIYRKFNAEARLEYLKGVARGHPEKVIAATMRLNPDVVDRWRTEGMKTEEQWMLEGRLGFYTKKGYKYRRYYIDLLAARAAGEGIPEDVVFRSAVGQEVVKEIEDPQTGEIRSVLFREDHNWQAALGLEKLREARLFREPRLRKAIAEAEVAEHTAERMSFDARLVQARALLAERALNPTTAALVFERIFMASLTPKEREVLEGAMRRQGLRAATNEDLDRAISDRTVEDADEMERFAKRWATDLPQGFGAPEAGEDADDEDDNE